MGLSEADERRVEAEVARMIEELRINPSQDKEDRIGVEIAVLPEEERDFVPTALLRFVAAERGGKDLPEPGPPPPPRRRWVNPLRFKAAYEEARGSGGEVEERSAD